MSIVSLKDYRWDGSKKLELKDAETGAPEFVDKKTLKAQTMENLAEAAAHRRACKRQRYGNRHAD